MFSSRLVRLARLDRLSPKSGVADRALVLAFSARFTDEVLAGAWSVLLPTFRRLFRLSLVEVGLLSQVLGWVALAVEPLAATAIDLHSRRRLMGVGAVALAVSVSAMAAAPSYGWLLVGFAAYGLGSGPLVHTGDVLVVEAFPSAPDRAFARASFLDTAGASSARAWSRPPPRPACRGGSSSSPWPAVRVVTPWRFRPPPSPPRPGAGAPGGH